MPTITLGNQRLFYAHRKRAEKQWSLLLLHGAGGSHLDWPPTLHRLPGVATFALDLPGHGRSQPPGRSSIKEYADVVWEFLDVLDLSEVVVAGHSMGGAIAQVIGLGNSPRLRALILVGTGARLRVADAILGRIRRDFEGAIETISSFRWSESASDEVVAAGHRLMREVGPETLHGDFLACNQFDVTGQLDQIRVPTLVIGATGDKLTPVKYGQYLTEQIPTARLVTIEGCGHMVGLERPSELTSAIASFLQEL